MAAAGGAGAPGAVAVGGFGADGADAVGGLGADGAAGAEGALGAVGAAGAAGAGASSAFKVTRTVSFFNGTAEVLVIGFGGFGASSLIVSCVKFPA